MESLSGHTFGKLQKCGVISWILLSDMAIESLSHVCAKSLNFDFAQNIVLSSVLEILSDRYCTPFTSVTYNPSAVREAIDPLVISSETAPV